MRSNDPLEVLAHQQKVIDSYPIEHMAYCAKVVKADICTCGLEEALSKLKGKT